MSDFSGTFNEISELLQKGKAKEIAGIVEKALQKGAAPADILGKGLIAGMNPKSAALFIINENIPA